MTSRIAEMPLNEDKGCRNNFNLKLGEISKIIYIKPSHLEGLKRFSRIDSQSSFWEKRKDFLRHIHSYLSKIEVQKSIYPRPRRMSAHVYVQDLRPKIRQNHPNLARSLGLTKRRSEATSMSLPLEPANTARPYFKQELKAISYQCIRVFDEIHNKRDPILKRVDCWYDQNLALIKDVYSFPSDPRISLANEGTVRFAHSLSSGKYLTKRSQNPKNFWFQAILIKSNLEIGSPLKKDMINLVCEAYDCVGSSKFENKKEEFQAFLLDFTDTLSRNHALNCSKQDIHQLCSDVFDSVEIYPHFLSKLETVFSEGDIRYGKAIRMIRLMKSLAEDVAAQKQSSLIAPKESTFVSYFKDRISAIEKQTNREWEKSMISFFSNIYAEIYEIEDTGICCDLYSKVLTHFFLEREKSSGVNPDHPYYAYWLKRIFEEGFFMRRQFEKTVDEMVDERRMQEECAESIFSALELTLKKKPFSLSDAFRKNLCSIPLDEDIFQKLCGVFDDGVYDFTF